MFLYNWPFLFLFYQILDLNKFCAKSSMKSSMNFLLKMKETFLKPFYRVKKLEHREYMLKFDKSNSYHHEMENQSQIL